MKKIAVEEHFTTEEHLDYLRSLLEKRYPVPEVLQEEKYIDRELPFLSPAIPGNTILTGRLLDVGADRLKYMTEAGIDIQVLTLVSPGVQVFDAATGTALAKKFNNKLAEIVREQPQRYAGLATVAPQSPNEAADELERSVRELGLKGAVINSHVKGEYLDDRKYWVIFERAEKLNVPIYIHPRSPSPDMMKPYLSYPLLDSSMLGFGAEVSLHAMRLICSGVFDEHPGLNIVLGHLGEALPFWLWRLDDMWRRGPLSKQRKKKPSQYIKDNFFITTSGMFSQPALLCSYLALGADRILFAVDHPMESMGKAVQFMEAAPICDSEKEKIYHLNAEKLLAL
ncbi:MAG: amidohydrolase family protein [Dehalococcoidia bacterium]|nr:amidohydrolase family protein [Dehalococcoidia bacterium]